jgi:hypothetical protein
MRFLSYKWALQRPDANRCLRFWTVLRAGFDRSLGWNCMAGMDLSYLRVDGFLAGELRIEWDIEALQEAGDGLF